MSSGGRLSGVRVLVPRPRERAEALVFLLEDEGARVEALPLLEFAPPAERKPLLAAAEQLHRYAWVVVASPAGLDGLLEAAREVGSTQRLGVPRWAAVGPRTRAACEAAGLAIALEATEATGEGLAVELLRQAEPGAEVLAAVAQEGRPELVQLLSDGGLRVTRVAAYRTDEVEGAGESLSALRADPPEAIVFGSPRTAEAFVHAAGGSLAGWERSRCVAIGPTTATAMTKLGLTVAAVAEQPTPEALVEAVVRAIRG